MIRFFANHPTAANLLMALFLVLGILTMGKLERETFPDFSTDQVSITVVYPGASPEEVEEAVCRRIEDAVEGVAHVDEIRSEARQNLGIITLEKSDSGNLTDFLNDIRTEVDAVDDLPTLAERPIIREVGATEQVVSIAVSGDMSPAHLLALCEDLRDRIQMLEEVSLVNMEGFSDRQIRIELRSEALQRHGLSVSDVAAVVSGQNLDFPAGTVETNKRDFVISVAEQRRKLNEYKDLVIMATPAGARITLGDLARITDVFEADEEKVIFNGRRAGILNIQKTENEDALRIFDAVTTFVEKERQVLPPGVSLDLTRDLSSVTRDRLRLLVTNGWQGLILVFLVMWLFFNLRLSFWVTMGLPVSFLGAFFFMPMLGLSINMITMVGLLLALGLLMDDAIVLSENVASHLAMGKKPMTAVIDGVKQVQAGVVSSFLTTVVVFGPLTMLEGNIGKIFLVMPMVLILVLSISLVEAFLILPNHLAHSLGHVDLAHPHPLRVKFEALIDRARDGLGRITDLALRWRYLTLGLAILALQVSVAMLAGGFLKFTAFPDLDGDVVQARLLLPQGTPLSRTEEVVGQIQAALERVDQHFSKEGDKLVKNLNIQYNINMDAMETGPHVATLFVDLKPSEQRNVRVDEVLNLWRQETGTITDVVNLTFNEPVIGPTGRPLEIRLQGADLDTLALASSEITHWFNSFDGVLDLSADLRPGKPEIKLRLREGAASLGLTAQALASQLRAAWFGATAGEIQVGSQAYEVDVRLAPEDANSLASLDQFPINLPNGGQAPLETLASLEQHRGYARIARVDGRRTVTIVGDIDRQKLNLNELVGLFNKTKLPQILASHPNVEVHFEGEIEEMAKTGGSLRFAFIIGLIGIFLILSYQFRSYVEPAVVMIAIPLSFCGVVFGHMLMGLDLAMPSMVGFVSLCGVVVNDSILLVEFIKEGLEEGKTLKEAASQASRSRFRAVLLTSLTTIAGLLPLLAERSMQAQILIPLAVSLVFGLMASTILVLIVIPCIYSILRGMTG